jgi:hypothetical protein
MTTDYTAQINALSQAIQFQPASASDISNFNAGLNSGSLTLAGVQSLLELEPYTTNYVNPVIREYQAAFGRVPDQAGLKFWVGAIAANPSALSSLGTTFASSAEFNTRYGANATTPAGVALVGELYANVLGRPGDSAGITFWANSGLNAAQLLTAFAQSPEFITDTTTAVTNYENLEAAGTPATTGSLFSLAPPPAGQTFTLTTGVDNINSTGANDTVLGTLAPSGATLNAGDQIAMNGGTLKITDTNTASPNELAGVNITGAFKFNVQDVAATQTYDFTAASGITAVQSTNSVQIVSFNNLAAGASVTASGAGTTATTLNFSMASASSAVTVGFDSGVNGLTIVDIGPSAVPTALTINSTGAANGTAAKPDVVNLQETVGKLTSVTINAATNLVAGFDSITQSLTTAAADFAAAGAALKVSGTATSVDLTRGNQGVYSTIDASGLTNGGLTVASDSVLTSFKGGAGNNTLLGTAISASATSINGGAAGVDNVLSSSLINTTNLGIFQNWQILDVTNNTNSAHNIDTALLTANGGVMTGVQINSTDTGTVATTVQHLAANATISLQGHGQADLGLTVTHMSAGPNTLAVTFADGGANAADVNTLTSLTSSTDTTMSIVSGGATAGQANVIGSILETDNVLTTITITGANALSIGGVATNSGASAGAASTLTLIDASGDTGGVTITAGAPSAFATYTGLVIKGGTGADNITNNAASGVVIEQNHAGDVITLGGKAASGTFGTGANDIGTANGVNDSFTFGAGATGQVVIGAGADVATVATPEQTNVTGALAGFKIDLHLQAGAVNTITNETVAVVSSGATSVVGAEDAAINAWHAQGEVYFTFGGDEYVVGIHTAETSISAGDAVVHLVGVSFTGLTAAAGVVTLH